jgi:putative endonuclease
MGNPKTYFVYIMSNRSKTLYTGVTSSLISRVGEHKSGSGSAFTSTYKLDRLVYFERFEDVHRAIGREKQIKGWLRMKKIALIVSVNPTWRNLSAEWYERHPFQPDKQTAATACHPDAAPSAMEEPTRSAGSGDDAGKMHRSFGGQKTPASG